MLNATDLPDDIEALKAMLLARDAALLASEAKVAHLSAELSTRTAEIEHLKLVLTKLKRMQFGRRSEKLDQQIEQLELQLEDLEAEAAVAEAQAPVDVAPRKKAERKPLPPHLPREERVQMPVSDACPECGGTLKRLGESVSEQLEYVPASFRVIRHVRPSWPAAAATPSCRHPPPAVRLSVVWPVPACWRTCWWPNSQITSRCTAKAPCMRAKA
jgi:DNA repair exonuclease SbcCD ATPase subunit